MTVFSPRILLYFRIGEMPDRGGGRVRGRGEMGRGMGRGAPSSGGRGRGRGGKCTNRCAWRQKKTLKVTNKQMIESKGGRGGGGSRGRGRGGNSFKKSGPNDPRVGSSVQIFVEGLPQVLLITFKNHSKDSRNGANSVLPPCVCAMRSISGLCFPIVSVCPTAPQA